MGITNISWKSLQEVFPDLTNKRVVELGDQEFVLPERLSFYGFDIRWSKNYYDLLGISHTTIDWHGNNGALVVDMSKPIHALLQKRFDMLTNFGMIEHVGDQYQAWKNIHNLVRTNGLMIHELPGQADFPGGHGIFPWYPTEFFEELAKKQNYKVVQIRYQQHDYHLFPGLCTWAALVKQDDNDFVSLEEFNKLDLRNHHE